MRTTTPSPSKSFQRITLQDWAWRFIYHGTTLLEVVAQNALKIYASEVGFFTTYHQEKAGKDGRVRTVRVECKQAGKPRTTGKHEDPKVILLPHSLFFCHNAALVCFYHRFYHNILTYNMVLCSETTQLQVQKGRMSFPCRVQPRLFQS